MIRYSSTEMAFLRSPLLRDINQIGGDSALKNPNWTRDELILALDLYLRVNPLHTSESHPDIVALSEILNHLPIHTDRPNAENFRNPNGVYMKLCNFLRLDPSYTGAGLRAGSHRDEEVWNEFAQDRSRLHTVSQSIRDTLQSTGEEAQSLRLVTNEDSEEAPEGSVLTKLHKIRERNREIIEKKKRKTLDVKGRLECEVCTFDFTETYGSLGNGFMECHHTTPISKLQPGQKTRLSDLALVCANCHRMLHRGPKWLSVEELRPLVKRTALVR